MEGWSKDVLYTGDGVNVFRKIGVSFPFFYFCLGFLCFTIYDDIHILFRLVEFPAVFAELFEGYGEVVTLIFKTGSLAFEFTWVGSDTLVPVTFNRILKLVRKVLVYQVEKNKDLH